MVNFNKMLLETDGGGAPKKPKDQVQTPVTEGGAKSYEDLDKALSIIDKQYTVHYVSPGLDLPESLGTEKLTYQMPSESEIMSQAQSSLASKYYTQAANIKSGAEKNSNSISDKIDQAELNALFKVRSLADKLVEDKEQVKNTALKRGLARSSIAENAVKETENVFERQEDEILSQKDANVGLMKRQLKDLQAVANQALIALEGSRTLETAAVAQKLLSDAIKKQEEVLKYNNSLNSNQAKYEASRATKIIDAQNAEYRRAAEVQKLLAEVGQEGLKQIVQKEKYIAVINYMDTLTKGEAREMLAARGDLPAELGGYYPLVEEYVGQRR